MNLKIFVFVYIYNFSQEKRNYGNARCFSMPYHGRKINISHDLTKTTYFV